MRNFFEHQQRARQRTGWLLLLFTLAVLLTVVFTDLVVAAAALLMDEQPARLPLARRLAAHASLLTWASVFTLAAIVLASLYRMASLSQGGGAVARSLGAKLVEDGTYDPRERQLRNIVEEMAIASGIPVPEVYVLESEPGINAFAAGYGPGDAAVAVTRGTLDLLKREELEGVIAHEFSHILNGDMRLNTRLIGLLFGILVIALAGRLIMRVASEAEGRAAAVGMTVGLALVVAGYSGLLCGRLIKAAVSRSREFLADASAVQFTRNPSGISGALKKIAVASTHTTLSSTEAEEVSHMLISDRASTFASLFATHPPIVERIQRLEPGFEPNDLQHIRAEPLPTVETDTETAVVEDTVAALSPAAVVATVGVPAPAARAVVRERSHELPDALRASAHRPEQAVAIVLALVLSRGEAERRRQLDRLRERLSPASFTLVEAQVASVTTLDLSLRLPLFDLAFPALRQRPRNQLTSLITLVEEVARLDGRLDAFDYTLSRLLRIQLTEALNPQASARAAHPAPKLHALRDEVQVLFSVLAQAGHADAGAARGAFDAGVRRLLPTSTATPEYAPPAPWILPLDRALARLDRLPPLTKKPLIESLVLTISYDHQITTSEAELLRVICAQLHCPLPPMAA